MGRATIIRRAVKLRSPSRQLEATFLPQVGMIGWSFHHRGDDLLAHPVDLPTYIETGEPTALATRMILSRVRGGQAR
jgi:hypothetical protein